MIHLLYGFLDFLPFQFLEYTFMKNAFLAVLVATPLFALLGTMAVNNKMAFFSDALGHSAFTGIAIGVLLGLGNPVISTVAFGIFLGLAISKVKSYNTASTDTIISVFSSVSVALGIVILSKEGGIGKYASYLVGDILVVTPGEILAVFLVLITVYGIWYKIYNQLLLVSINADLASSRGINHQLIENIFVAVLAVSVMLCVKWIGVLVINSLLILPAAAARNIARNSAQYHLFALIISMASGIFGLVFSFYFNTAAGAAMVIVAAGIFFATLLIKQANR